MILCVGTTPVYQRSMVFERLAINDVNRAVTVCDYASGKSINVATVLATIGHDARAVGFAGGDTGKAMLAGLSEFDVRCDFVRTPTPTRQCITVIDRSAGTATELVEEATWVAGEYWTRLAEKLEKWVPRARGCVFSGSLPRNGPDDFYLSCLRRVAPGVPVIVDARGDPLRQALRHGGGFIAKLNRDELGMTVGLSIDSDERLRNSIPAVLPRNGWVVVTAGGEGAVVASAAEAWRVVPPQVRVKSAVGSGDAFAAGMIFRLVHGAPMREAAAFGAACGAANAMTDMAGRLDPREVETLRKQVRVEAF